MLSAKPSRRDDAGLIASTRPRADRIAKRLFFAVAGC
jgi:hypothetical protein